MLVPLNEDETESQSLTPKTKEKGRKDKTDQKKKKRKKIDGKSSGRKKSKQMYDSEIKDMFVDCEPFDSDPDDSFDR